VFLVRDTEFAASTSIEANHLLPLRDPAGLCLPADSCIAGATPAQAARCAADGNRDMSGASFGDDHLRGLQSDTRDGFSSSN
jgi:hypothetical protein